MDSGRSKAVITLTVHVMTHLTHRSENYEIPVGLDNNGTHLIPVNLSRVDSFLKLVFLS